MGRLINIAPAMFDLYGGGFVYLSDAFEEFKSYMAARGYAEKTIQTYEDHVRDFLKFADNKANGYVPDGCKGFPACNVKRLMIVEWEARLRQRGNRDTTVRTKIKSLKTFLYWCMDNERGYCDFFHISLPKAAERLKELYTKEEIETILVEPKSKDLSEWRNWAAVNTILRTGLRRASVCEIRWDDIDFESQRLLMRHSKTRKQIFVPLPMALIEVLRLWKEISPDTKEGYVFFSTYTEGKLQPNSLTQAIRKYNLSRGVNKTSVHLMRHSYATIYLKKGGQIGKLQKILGHESIEMTQKYVHYLTDDLIEDINEYTV